MIHRGEIRWFRFAAPDKRRLKPEWIRIVERRHLGPLIATLPEQRWPELRSALLDVLGFEP